MTDGTPAENLPVFNHVGLLFGWCFMDLRVYCTEMNDLNQQHVSMRRLLTTFECLEGSFHFIDSVVCSEGQELDNFTLFWRTCALSLTASVFMVTGSGVREGE